MAPIGRVRVAAVPAAALVLDLFAGLAACVQAEPPGASAAQVRTALTSGRPTLIDLGARHCVPCKRMAPILEALAGTCQSKTSVLFVDVDADRDRTRAFLFSLCFVLGLALTFTALGAATALFGSLGGGWYLAVGVLAPVPGGHMMGLYRLRLPSLPVIQPRQRGLARAFVLGLFFGVVSSPCATPALVVTLAFAATRGEMLYGVALLFVYALGHCVLMLAAGTFAGFVETFARARGVADVSAWAQRLGDAPVALVGGYLVWHA